MTLLKETHHGHRNDHIKELWAAATYREEPEHEGADMNGWEATREMEEDGDTVRAEGTEHHSVAREVRTCCGGLQRCWPEAQLCWDSMCKAQGEWRRVVGHEKQMSAACDVDWRKSECVFGGQRIGCCRNQGKQHWEFNEKLGCGERKSRLRRSCRARSRMSFIEPGDTLQRHTPSHIERALPDAWPPSATPGTSQMLVCMYASWWFACFHPWDFLLLLWAGIKQPTLHCGITQCRSIKMISHSAPPALDSW